LEAIYSAKDKLMKLALLISIVVVLLVAAYLGVGYLLYDQLSTVHHNPKNAANTPAHFQVNEAPFPNFDATPYEMPNYETVRLPSRQPGLMLAGWYVPGDPSAPAVVVTHGMSSCKCEGGIIVAAGMLHRHGFNVLLYDLRNHGESDSDNGRTAMGNKEYLDALGAWDWLRTAKGFPPERIGLYGGSLGAGTTMMAFGQEPRIAALFVDSPFFDLRQLIDEKQTSQHYPTFLAFGGLLMARVVGGVDLLAHSPQDAITHDAGRPIFIVHGTGDQSINIHHSRDLVKLAEQTGADVTTWFPEGLDHHPHAVLELSGEYEQRLATFFSGALEK
jgi:dipeptidyl aminopeptidase/acylaminoacyl peptidase